jgi:hypothetical protein
LLFGSAKAIGYPHASELVKFAVPAYLTSAFETIAPEFGSMDGFGPIR